MKYFFIRKDEHFGGGDKFIQHPVKRGGRNLIVINEEVSLKKVIQDNNIEKFRRIDPFRNGSVVRLRKTNGFRLAKDREELDGLIVTLKDLNLEKNSRFTFDGNDGSEIMVDSIDEVIKY